MKNNMIRTFRLWDYNVSHDQLLLRSPITDEHDTNLDVVFWGVRYLQIPTRFQEIQITRGTNDDSMRLSAILGEAVPLDDIFCLCESATRYLVVAAGYKVLSNRLDLFVSSLEYFRIDNAPENRGDVLDHS